MRRAPPEIRDLCTIPELSRRLGIGVRAIRAAIADGSLPAYSPAGVRTRVLWTDALVWVRRSRVAPRNAAERSFIGERVAAVLHREGGRLVEGRRG
jgi:hypothetical protein